MEATSLHRLKRPQNVRRDEARHCQRLFTLLCRETTFQSFCYLGHSDTAFTLELYLKVDVPFYRKFIKNLHIMLVCLHWVQAYRHGSKLIQNDQQALGSRIKIDMDMEPTVSADLRPHQNIRGAA